MKIFFATDPHVTAQPPSSRIDDFLESICNKFSWIRSQVSEDDWLLLGGDVFNRFHVSDGAVNALLRVLPRNVASIFGNHDFNRRAVEGFEENPLS